MLNRRQLIASLLVAPFVPAPKAPVFQPVVLSQEMLLASAISAEEFVMRALQKRITQIVDSQFIHGTGQI